MFCKLIIFVLIIFCAKSYAHNGVEANWEGCTVSPTSTLKSQDVKVYISNCTRNQTECKLYKGSSPQLTIIFNATTSCRTAERGIVAQLFMPAFGRKIEIPYGPCVNPCSSDNGQVFARNEDNSTVCSGNSIEEGKSYTYVSSFKVMNEFPQVSGIDVRIILRCKGRARGCSLRRWRSNKEDHYVCAVIRNVSVV